MKTWTDREELGSTWLIRLIVWLARTMGRSLCRALIHPIVAYYVLTDPMARRASAEFLQAATQRPARLRDVMAHMRCFAVTLLDRVYMAAGDFGRMFPDGWQDRVRAANYLGRAAGLAREDATLTGEQRARVVREYSDAAMTLLREAFDRGWRNPAALAKATADLLEPRGDFRELLAKLSGNKMP